MRIESLYPWGLASLHLLFLPRRVARAAAYVLCLRQVVGEGLEVDVRVVGVAVVDAPTPNLQESWRLELGRAAQCNQDIGEGLVAQWMVYVKEQAYKQCIEAHLWDSSFEGAVAGCLRLWLQQLLLESHTSLGGPSLLHYSFWR